MVGGGLWLLMGWGGGGGGGGGGVELVMSHDGWGPVALKGIPYHL